MEDPEGQFRGIAQIECIKVAQAICDLIAMNPNTPYDRTNPKPDSEHLKYSYHPRVEPEGVIIVSNVRYWGYVEYGTGKGRAQPHVRPAIEEIRARMA
jgi:hypothetical protein